MKYALAFAASFVLVWFIVLPQVATSEGIALLRFPGIDSRMSMG
jgi:hypothetical protein